MRLSHLFLRIGVFVIAAIACTLAARATVAIVEDVSVMSVQEDLVDAQMPWASVLGDGLQVIIEGEAPTEAARFRAISTAGRVVDASRVIDNMSVVDTAGIAAPDFAVEILRGDSGVSIIGLIPTATDREALDARITQIARGLTVTDLLETADYPVPDSWRDAMTYALRALDLLPRSKISVSDGRIAITAIADSATQKADFETALARNVPQGVRRQVRITAPRPVISPYTIRFTQDDDGARFAACAADSPATEQQIMEAAIAAGYTGRSTCVQALGVPSRTWGRAAALAIKAVTDIGGGTVTLADTDITLVGLETTDQDTFDRITGVLENALPDVYALSTDLPRPPEATADGPPTFTALRSPEGAVQLRGRMTDDLSNMTAENYAAAKFGATNVTMGTRVTGDLPQDWSMRVLAGIEVLAQLKNGSVSVTPDLVTVKGNTGNANAPAIVTNLLISKLGQTAEADLDITYVKELDPSAGLPTPDECIANIENVTEGRKIGFDPGSATLTSDSQPIVDDIAEILQRCPDIRLQIAGYTDSQGGEEMNQELSQTRADAVLTALRVRRIPIATFTAIGYGEADPIADNDTADGREANRRIAFSLTKTEEETTTLDDVAAESEATSETANETNE
ncbi:OmpA family protein [Loktanella salsilacus]|jgi:OOP family OmpA-OmpF porin|uniref:OmpA family protein n=1 Tax=Loktanella salsilacus TaxID=195913 RepID=UPI0020B6B34E|nr:OmpA family protein [Loktanella salsilacus]UTH47464.1 OmpA family protein [Loktanella salsilacus]